MGYGLVRHESLPPISFEVEDGHPEDTGPKAILLWAWAKDKNGQWKAYHYHRLLASKEEATKMVPYLAAQVFERGDQLVPGGLRLLVVRG